MSEEQRSGGCCSQPILFENFNEIIYRLDERSVITYISPSLGHLTGYTPEEVLGRPFTDFAHPDDLTGRLEQFKKVLYGDTGPSEYRFVDKDGTHIWFRTYARPIIENGRSVGIQGVLTDITERKEAEFEMERMVHERDILLNNIDALVWYLLDEETHGLFNQARSDFFGIEEKNMGRRSTRDIMAAKEEAETCIAGNKRVFSEKRRIHTEEWVTSADGEKRLLSITKTPVFNVSGDVEYVVCVANDITKRYRIQASLEEYQRRASQAQAFTRTGVWEYNIPERTLYWSSECAAIFGMDENLFQGRFGQFMELVHPEDRDYVIRMSRLAGEKPGNALLEYDHRIIRPDGEMRWVRESAGIVRNRSGKPLRATGFVMDITERKLVQNAYDQQIDEYEMLFQSSAAPAFLVEVISPESFRLIRSNRAYQSATGIQAYAFQNKTPAELWGEEAGGRFTAFCTRCVRDASPVSFEDVFEDAGENRIWQFTLNPVPNRSARISHIVGSGADITAFRKNR